jgi:CRISPR-associated endonuclease/helicase Cas3
LLSPKAGLQLLFAILRLRQRWGLLSCVMTATMPESVANFFKEFCGLEIVQASAEDINKRDSWRKVNLQLLGERTPGHGSSKSRKEDERPSFEWQEKDPQGIAELVKEKWEGWSEVEVDGPRKIIVFMNTVDRAIEVYKHLQGLCPNIVLAHSRFTKEHRQQVEDLIQQFFGKESQETEGILVTTQVAEAGLNISAPLVISELAPMDSLIQRAGRCQRFKPEGDREMQGLVLVVKPRAEGRLGWYVPYIDYVTVRGNKDEKRIRIAVAEVSRYVLEECFANRKLLDWDLEKDVVNEAFSEAYEAFLKGSDSLQLGDVKDKPLGRVYRRLAKISLFSPRSFPFLKGSSTLSISPKQGDHWS